MTPKKPDKLKQSTRVKNCLSKSDSYLALESFHHDCLHLKETQLLEWEMTSDKQVSSKQGNNPESLKL